MTASALIVPRCWSSPKEAPQPNALYLIHSAKLLRRRSTTFVRWIDARVRSRAKPEGVAFSRALYRKRQALGLEPDSARGQNRERVQRDGGHLVCRHG
jgi:hypothetical protein